MRPVCSHFCRAGKSRADRQQGPNLKVMTPRRREASSRRNGVRNDFLAQAVWSCRLGDHPALSLSLWQFC